MKSLSRCRSCGYLELAAAKGGNFGLAAFDIRSLDFAIGIALTLSEIPGGSAGLREKPVTLTVDTAGLPVI